MKSNFSESIKNDPNNNELDISDDDPEQDEIDYLESRM